ncbi:MAG: hypothetical protein EOS76_01275 [Mesorhizobium sp.]|uniref:hypothetical protein n=1 Tax=unclassified Mesorhizobium TaxID=325217 RepID=UPI000F76090C|nr:MULTISPECIES: hypothetical protein [unclassified Mesorhizobium]RVC81956.1 hypothetical protein EN766_02140 [Mesorhizobium sp. M2A.F.Ca.ET.046.02.1.1]AZO34223.1 hypothetical protein EJ072_06910 [Mesorhizobium sp. M2A.F.Ca.ET.046.03.2.1]AZO71655.1 hypothetical protein EJ067_11285 [Mesorhizobium sp. M1D.F.Ca.ET.043.01.1.1]RWB49767.1 MAG: hypothetical protein EOQ44_01185 [Mesorhizobium sp.]RWE22463.1 MAG: hypothetical protein EOS76_01275 [Mesorhizobium sp.]
MVATPVESIWTSKDIVTAIVATGLVTAAASWCVDLFKTWWSKRNAARYGAMRCATELERYAVDCWHVFIMGHGEFQMHQDITNGSLPPAPDFPNDVDWKALAPQLANDVLSFSNITKISESLANYAHVWERNPFDYHATAKERGLEALKLAGRLRSAYDLRSPSGLDRAWKELQE